MFQIFFYQQPNGEKPALQFLKSIQDTKLRVKVLRQIKLLETFGPELRYPDTRYIRDGVFELRAIQGGNIVRCMFFFYEEHRIIITNGFLKKSGKTPLSEIRLAIDRKSEYERRMRHE